MSDANRAAKPLGQPWWVSRIWLYIPLLVCVLIMLPRLISPQFGLLDDGRSLSIARGIAQGKWDLSWDIQAGRVRPVYWAAFAFWYLLAHGHAFWYFFGNLILFSATTLLLMRLVIELGGSNLQACLTGIFFTLSTPLIENYYTLSKGESIQVFLLVASIWLVVLAVKAGKGAKYWITLTGACVLVLIASFTKENTLIMIPISLAWWAMAWVGRKRRISSAVFAEQVTRWIGVASVLSGAIFYIVRSLVLSARIIGVGQSSEFSFNRTQILNGLVRGGGWLLRDYIWLLPLIIVVLVWCLVKRRWPRSGLWWFTAIWMAFWLVLYLPWHFALEYYLLPFAAGTAVLAGLFLIDLLELIKQPPMSWKVMSTAAVMLTVLLLLATQANSFTDGSIQLAQDAANASAMQYIVKNAPSGSLVVVNIQLANEYIEQMQLMLADFYDRGDMQLVNYQGQDLEQLKTQYPATYVLVPAVANQPKMTVRVGLIEDSVKDWNATLLPMLNSWHETFQVSRDPRILSIDFPRLLCALIYRENYCSSSAGLVNYQVFHYQWTVYTAR